MPRSVPVRQQCHIRSGPLTRSWLPWPFRRSIQATGAPSGVTRSAELDGLRVRGVTARGNDAVHVTDANGLALPPGGPFVDPLDSLAPAQNINRDPEDGLAFAACCNG